MPFQSNRVLFHANNRVQNQNTIVPISALPCSSYSIIQQSNLYNTDASNQSSTQNINMSQYIPHETMYYTNPSQCGSNFPSLNFKTNSNLLNRGQSQHSSISGMQCSNINLNHIIKANSMNPSEVIAQHQQSPHFSTSLVDNNNNYNNPSMGIGTTACLPTNFMATGIRSNTDARSMFGYETPNNMNVGLKRNLVSQVNISGLVNSPMSSCISMSNTVQHGLNSQVSF